MSPQFSIIIPARNEEAFLPDCLSAIVASAKHAQSSYEVIVVINRCTDATEKIASNFGARIVREDAKNLSKIRNSGAKVAQGQIIVTVDADSLMSENMLSKIDSALSRPDCIGGGVLIVPSRWSVGILLTALCILPLALYYRISGGLFFCRPEDFWAIGGFDEQLSSVEDIDFARRLKRFGKDQGRRYINLFSAYIITSMRKFDRFGDWYFLFRPHLLLSLLKGRNQSGADKVWYDFER